jgi:hypothetical protein
VNFGQLHLPVPGMNGEIAHKGDKVPIQTGQR